MRAALCGRWPRRAPATGAGPRRDGRGGRRAGDVFNCEAVGRGPGGTTQRRRRGVVAGLLADEAMKGLGIAKRGCSSRAAERALLTGQRIGSATSARSSGSLGVRLSSAFRRPWTWRGGVGVLERGVVVIFPDNMRPTPGFFQKSFETSEPATLL